MTDGGGTQALLIGAVVWWCVLALLAIPTGGVVFPDVSYCWIVIDYYCVVVGG